MTPIDSLLKSILCMIDLSVWGGEHWMRWCVALARSLWLCIQNWQALPAAAEKMAPSVTNMDLSSDICAPFLVLCRFNEIICWILKDLKKTSNTVRLWIGLEILVGRFLPFSAQAIH